MMFWLVHRPLKPAYWSAETSTYLQSSDTTESRLRTVLKLWLEFSHLRHDYCTQAE